MTRKLKRIFLFALSLLLATVAAFAVADGAWLRSVPTHDHARTNPYGRQPDAIAAGRRVFEERCAGCHGKNAEGKKKRPTLKSPRVQQEATEGDLHWLLVNGNMKKGMPSWAKLPDQQIWQVISFVKSLH